MEKQQLLKADYLDILYDNRNKNYGGYELRRKYPDRARRATYMVLLAAGMLSSIPVIAGILNGSKPNKTSLDFAKPTVTTIVELPREKVQPPKPVTKPAEAAAIKATVAIHELRIMPTDQVTVDAPRPVDSLGDREVGRNNNSGKPGGTVADNGQRDGDGPIPTDPPTIVDPPLNKPMILVSQMPQFNGDVGDYLQKHLNYPEPARVAGEQGRAVVKFVVNEDGAISNTEIVASAKSASLDREALRVVSSMPKWKPGKHQGKEVKVYFNLPITFKLD
jgi:protein TonB